MKQHKPKTICPGFGKERHEARAQRCPIMIPSEPGVLDVRCQECEKLYQLRRKLKKG